MWSELAETRETREAREAREARVQANCLASGSSGSSIIVDKENGTVRTVSSRQWTWTGLDIQDRTGQKRCVVSNSMMHGKDSSAKVRASGNSADAVRGIISNVE